MQYEKVLPSVFKTALQNDEELTYHTVAGCQDRSFRQHLSGPHNTTETQWDIQTPGPQVLMNKRVMCEIEATISVEHTSGAMNAPVFANDFQLRPFAPLSAINTLHVALNGNEKDYYVSELIPVLSRYNNTWSNSDAQWGGVPTLQDFSSLANAGAATGASLNIPRGSTVFLKSDVVSGATRTRIYRLRFPLMGPGLSWGSEEEPDGLTLLNKLSVRIRWATNLADLLFCQTATPAEMTMSAVTFPDKPSLFIEYITPTVDLNKSVIAYNVKHYQPHRTEVTGAAPNVVAGEVVANQPFGPIQSQTISFNTVPNAIYVYVKQQVGDFSMDVDPQVFADLTRIQIQWRNKTISYESEQMTMLGLQSIANGCNIPLAYQNTNIASDGRAGACYKFIVGKDLPLEPELFAGSNTGSGMTLQISVNGINRHNTRKLSLYVLVEMDQTMYLSSGQSVTEDGFLSNVTQELAMKPFLPKVYSGGGVDLKRHILKGWDSVIHRIPQTLKDANNAMGIAEKYQKMAALNSGGSTSGGMYMAGSSSGGKILGGNYKSRF